MECSFRGRSIRRLVYASCIVLSSALSAAAQAQVSHYWNEKFAKPSETTLHLGSAVAAGGGQVVAVGSGTAYSFAMNSSGEWTQTAKIVAPEAGILTGPMEFDGSNLLVRGYTPAQVSVVYAYTFDGSRYRAVGILKGAVQFGAAIALDGCTALISSTNDSWRANEPGESPRAFVHYFDRCRTGQWTYINTLPQPNGAQSANDMYGTSIAVSGNMALVGAPNVGWTAATGSYGVVYYYTRSGDTWSLKQNIEETGTDRHRGFGKTVAISNTLALIAASFKDEERGYDGTVIAFGTDGTTWTQVGPVTFYESPENGGYDDFGRKIVIKPDRVYISAPGHSQLCCYYGSGIVYAFMRSGPSGLLPSVNKLQPWAPLAPGVPPEAQYTYQAGHYGADFAVSGANLFIGSPERHLENKLPLVNGLLSVYEAPPYTPPP